MVHAKSSGPTSTYCLRRNKIPVAYRTYGDIGTWNQRLTIKFLDSPSKDN